MACGCGYAHAVHRTIDTLYYYDKTNMDSRLSSSSEKRNGKDVDSVESAINEGEYPGCTTYRYSYPVL